MNSRVGSSNWLVTACGSELPTVDSETLTEIANRIRARERDIADSGIEVGRELIRAKAALSHGEFSKWVATEFGWAGRTAQQFMRAAEVFGDKSDIVSCLGATAIYELSARSTPEAVRDEVVARLAAGEPLTQREVIDQLKVARQEAKAVPAPAMPQRGVVEQAIGEISMGQVFRRESLRNDQQADMSSPARRAAELILQQIKHREDELAHHLEEADADELLTHLLRGCKVGKV